MPLGLGPFPPTPHRFSPGITAQPQSGWVPPHGAPAALPTAHWLGGLFPWRHPGFFVTPMSSQSLGGSVGRWPRTAAFPDIRAMCGTGVWCVGGRQCCLREWDGRARGSQPLRAGLVTPRGESCALGHEGRCQLTLSPCLPWYRLVAVASGDCGIGVGGRRSAARGCWSDAPLGAGSSGSTRGRSSGGVKTALRVRGRPRGDARTACAPGEIRGYPVLGPIA